MDVTTTWIDVSDNVYFFVTEEGGIHLQCKTGGVITLNQKELENLRRLTNCVKTLEVLYGNKRKTDPG